MLAMRMTIGDRMRLLIVRSAWAAFVTRALRGLLKAIPTTVKGTVWRRRACLVLTVQVTEHRFVTSSGNIRSRRYDGAGDHYNGVQNAEQLEFCASHNSTSLQNFPFADARLHPTSGTCQSQARSLGVPLARAQLRSDETVNHRALRATDDEVLVDQYGRGRLQA